MGQFSKSIRKLQLPACIVVLAHLLSLPALGESPKHTLWAVKGESNTVYLLGSIHVLTEDAYPLPQPMMDAFQDSEKIVFETDVEATFSEEVNKYMTREGYYSDTETLWDNLDQKTGKELRTLMKELNLPGLMFHRMKPWQVVMTLVITMYQAEGFKAEYGIDRHFYALAKNTDKSVTFFEPVIYQLKLFGELPDSEQLNLIHQTLDEYDDMSEIVEKMYLAGKDGDAQGIFQLTEESFAEYPFLKDRLLTRRNHNWIPDIEKFLKEKQNILIVVGAGHLAGKESVVDLLQKKGYAVRQL